MFKPSSTSITFCVLQLIEIRELIYGPRGSPALGTLWEGLGLQEALHRPASDAYREGACLNGQALPAPLMHLSVLRQAQPLRVTYKMAFTISRRV